MVIAQDVARIEPRGHILMLFVKLSYIPGAN